MTPQIVAGLKLDAQGSMLRPGLIAIAWSWLVRCEPSQWQSQHVQQRACIKEVSLGPNMNIELDMSSRLINGSSCVVAMWLCQVASGTLTMWLHRGSLPDSIGALSTPLARHSLFPVL